jgi:hypothetical protein
LASCEASLYSSSDMELFCQSAFKPRQMGVKTPSNSKRKLFFDNN